MFLWRFSAFVACSTAIFHCCFQLVGAVIPEYIQVCKRNDPNLGSCMKSSIENLRGKLAQGIPELNIPSVEPLYLPRLELQQNANINLTDLYIHGPSTFDIVDINVDIKKNRFAFLYKFEELKFNGNYDLDMQVLRIPLKSSGPIHGYFKNCQITGKMQGRKTTINDKVYLVFRPIEIKIYQGKTRMFMDNLFRGQKELQEAAKDLLNENNELLNNEILPSLEKKLGEFYTLIANRIASQFTYDELFPLN